MKQIKQVNNSCMRDQSCKNYYLKLFLDDIFFSIIDADFPKYENEKTPSNSGKSI